MKDVSMSSRCLKKHVIDYSISLQFLFLAFLYSSELPSQYDNSNRSVKSYTISVITQCCTEKSSLDPAEGEVPKSVTEMVPLKCRTDIGIGIAKSPPTEWED